MSSQEIRGAELTFEEFVTATAGRLLRTAVFLVYDRHLAEDLLQATYERIAKRWQRIAVDHPEAYARKILVNLAIDEGRRRARRPDIPVGSVTDIDRMARPRPEPENSADLDEVLAALPAKQRAVVVLRYWCDLTELEIADTLGISPGTVKSHASRALAALRTQMADRDGDADGGRPHER